MPIVIQSVSLDKYLAFISSSQNSPPLTSFKSSPLEYNLAKPSFPSYPYVQVRCYSSSTGNSNSGPRLSHVDRKAIVVTVEQHEVIMGSLLGDMSATRPGPKHNTRLTIGQSKSNQSYLLSLAALLSTLIRQPNVTPDNKFDRKTGTQFYGYKFCSMSLPCLNIYREWFYPQGTKIWPANIADHLTPLGLGHWYMQDGSKTTDNGVTFATHCFNEAELQLLIQALSTKFGLNCTQQKMGGGNNQKAIYVRRASIPTFIELVSPHIHPSMLYKLPTR